MGNSSITTLSNRLLLLWLLHDAMKFKAAGDTKAHKLAYLAQLEMTNQQEKGLSYNFKKLPFGPYSDELQADVSWLEEQDLIQSRYYQDGKIFSDSKFGEKLLADFADMYIRNSEFTRKIFTVNRKYATYTTFQLVDVVHHLQHPYKSMTIDDAPLNDWILCALPNDKAKREFTITAEELATLEIYLDEESYRSATSACYFAQRKPLLSLDEVF